MNKANKTKLEKIINGFEQHLQLDGKSDFYFNPDNHDQVNMAISLLHIESNERIAESNEKYAKAMNILTGGLLFVGVVQIILEIFK